LSLLAAEAYRAIEIDALLGRATVHVVRGERLLPAAQATSSPCSPARPGRRRRHGRARYPLHGETCCLARRAGLQHLRRRARVSVSGGVLLAIRPYSFAQEPGHHHQAAGIGFSRDARVHQAPTTLPLRGAHAADAVSPGEQDQRRRRRSREEAWSLPVACAGGE